jgi:hypothetical protein
MNRYKLFFLLIAMGLCIGKADAQIDTTVKSHTDTGIAKKKHKNSKNCKKCGEPMASRTDPCDSLTVDNFFGEVPSSYTNNTIVYVYDFSEKLAKRRFYRITKKDSLLTKPCLVNMSQETLPVGADVYLKLVNINKFMYDITLSDTTAGFETMPSPIFSKTLSGDTVLATILNATTANQGSAELGQDLKLDTLRQEIRNWTEGRNNLLRKMTDAYNPCFVFPCCNPKDTGQINGLADLLVDIQQRAVGYVNTFDKAKTDLQKLQSVTTNSTDTLSRESADQGIVANYGWVVALLANLPSEPDVRRAIVFVNNMVQRNLQELYPLSTEGSFLDLTINIRSKDSIVQFFSIPLYNDPPLHYRIPILYKPFITFSAGPFVGVDRRLKNKTYAWQAIPDNTNTVQSGSNYLLVENGYTENPYGFCIFGNLQWRLRRNFSLGPTGGIGLTLQSHSSISPLAGGSLFFGNIGQLVLTGGIMGLGINYLSNEWKNVYYHQTVYTAPQTLSYYKAFSYGAFVSVTYTPFHQ